MSRARLRQRQEITGKSAVVLSAQLHCPCAAQGVDVALFLPGPQPSSWSLEFPCPEVDFTGDQHHE